MVECDGLAAKIIQVALGFEGDEDVLETRFLASI
jgi:hypothetical protein